MRSQITKVASFPAAWAISNKAGVNFWSLYGSIVESKNCNVSWIYIFFNPFRALN